MTTYYVRRRLCSLARRNSARMIASMHSIDTTIRSDGLPNLRSLFGSGELEKLFPRILQVSLVLDASSVIADLRWLEKKRQDETARSKLQEVLAAETILAYAPSYLKFEMQQKLPLLAKKDQLSLKSLQAHWTNYQTQIRFIDTGGADSGFADPCDAPYVKLQSTLENWILTQDNDFEAMGTPTVNYEFVDRLCTYSRRSAVEYTLKATGISATAIAGLTVKAMIDAVQQLIGGLKRLPPSIQLVVLGIIAALLIHPTARARLLGTIGEIASALREHGAAGLRTLAPLVQQHEIAKEHAGLAREQMLELLEKTTIS